jgi:hypothetical protein
MQQNCDGSEMCRPLGEDDRTKNEEPVGEPQHSNKRTSDIKPIPLKSHPLILSGAGRGTYFRTRFFGRGYDVRVTTRIAAGMASLMAIDAVLFITLVGGDRMKPISFARIHCRPRAA